MLKFGIRRPDPVDGGSSPCGEWQKKNPHPRILIKSWQVGKHPAYDHQEHNCWQAEKVEYPAGTTRAGPCRTAHASCATCHNFSRLEPWLPIKMRFRTSNEVISHNLDFTGPSNYDN